MNECRLWLSVSCILSLTSYCSVVMYFLYSELQCRNGCHTLRVLNFLCLFGYAFCYYSTTAIQPCNLESDKKILIIYQCFFVLFWLRLYIYIYLSLRFTLWFLMATVCSNIWKGLSSSRPEKILFDLKKSRHWKS